MYDLFMLPSQTGCNKVVREVIKHIILGFWGVVSCIRTCSVTKYWNIDFGITLNMGRCQVLLECGVKLLGDKLWHNHWLLVNDRLTAYHSLTMTMSTHCSSDSPPLVIGITKSRCHWTEANKLAFINFLLDHKAEARDGGNFKRWCKDCF